MAEEKVAIVTAGGSGMGAGAARKLSQDGFRVAILSSSGKGEALAEELGGIGVTGSNQSNDDLKRLVDLAMERWGRVDALVNSAGHGPRAPVLELSDEDWHEVCSLTVCGFGVPTPCVYVCPGGPVPKPKLPASSGWRQPVAGREERCLAEERSSWRSWPLFSRLLSVTRG